MNYLFFDIECANCFQGKGKICSFGYVLTDERFNVLEKEDILINPHAKFFLRGKKDKPAIVLAYEEEEFKNAPSFPHQYNQIRAILTQKDVMIFGFSVTADANYIKCDCERYEKEIFDYDFIDIQRLMVDIFSLENTPSLLNAALKFSEEEHQDIHKSDDDAYMTMNVLKGICKETSLSVPELIEKYPLCRCWIKDGEISSEFFKYKEIQKANKLSKMEVLTGSLRSNWIYNNPENRDEFYSYVKNVFRSKKIPTVWTGKSVCFSNLYEDYHFNEMMNIVSLLGSKGARYTKKATFADIFVTFELESKGGKKFPCYRMGKIKRAISLGAPIEIISFEEFLARLGVEEETLKELDRKKLFPLYRRDFALK